MPPNPALESTRMSRSGGREVAGLLAFSPRVAQLSSVRQDMDTIAAKLRELIVRYRARGMTNGDGMLPPADIGVIAESERRLGFDLPPSLRAIYAVFGGQEYTGVGVTGIFGRHRLQTPVEVANDYQMYQNAEESADAPRPPPGSLPGKASSRWHPALVPFASWDAYSIVICRYTHHIWEFEPYSGLSPRNFQSIDDLLDVALDAANTLDEPSVDFITAIQTIAEPGDSANPHRGGRGSDS